MAKRTRKAKSSRSNLRVETLEQRQLLATIVSGAGTEVASNVDLPNGRYDQILLTGPSVTVMADVNEVVRVSFLDQGGDIVQAEFAGKGTMTVSLEDIKTGASVINKNPDQKLANGQPVNYVQGLATITIANPQIDTNVGIYAAGILQNPGFFTGQAKQGDNNLADIARLILVGDPTNGGGYSNMGGIRAGSTVFSASSGVVGIRGENVAVHDVVAIGDIDAKGSGVPTLMFNSNSQFQTVFVRGGDLFQSNGASFDSFGGGQGGAPGGSPGNPNNITLGGFSYFNSTDGTTSGNVKIWSTPVNQSAIRLATVDQQTLMSGDWVYDWSNPQSVKVTQNGVDVSAVYGGDWLAKGGIQASLDLAFERRTFEGNVTIKSNLPAGFELNMADARKNVTFEGNLSGLFTVNGFGASIDGTLTIKGDLDGSVLVAGLDRALPIPTTTLGTTIAGLLGIVPIAPLSNDGQLNRINAIVVEGSTTSFADVRAEAIGNVTIRRNHSGIVSTDVNRSGGWSANALTATGYVDYEGALGNISVGYDAAGASTGGSIIDGAFQGMAGIGNAKVGGDIWGRPQAQVILPGVLGFFPVTVNPGIFSTASNPGAAPTDVRNFGTASMGTLNVLGDVDLDNGGDLLINIAGNGVYGDINIKGTTTTNTVPGPQIGTKTEVIPGSDSFVRILSPFTDKGFTVDATKGQKLVFNYDPDGVAGPQNDTYFVTKSDVTAGAQIYDLTTGKLVAAKEGDRVPALNNLGTPIFDAFGNVVYAQNTALFSGKTQVVPIFGPDIVTIVSGNRGNLNGVFNNFGRIAIGGLAYGVVQDGTTLPTAKSTTGSITWTDTVDMTFGGVTVNSSGLANLGVVGTKSMLGQITINNGSGLRTATMDSGSDLMFVGPIGSVNGAAAGNNPGTAFVGLTGLTVNQFEDVDFWLTFGGLNGIHATQIQNGISVTTVKAPAGSDGFNQGVVSPSIVFDSRILLDNGTSEGNQQSGSILKLDAGSVNSTIGFTNTAGIVVNDGGNTGNGSQIAPISLAADYVFFNGVLVARDVGAITLTGGSGIGSLTDTGVMFGGTITADKVASLTASATGGDVFFVPAGMGPNSPQVAKTAFGPIALTTAGTNNGGNITFGASGTVYNPNAGAITAPGVIYNVNNSSVTLTAGHKLFLSQAGTIVDNPGMITINYATSGNFGDSVATTTTGDINEMLYVRGNAGNITRTASVAVVDKTDTYGGAPGDLVRNGSISTTQTIIGTRGVTNLSTAGWQPSLSTDGKNTQLLNADGTAAVKATTVDFTILDPDDTTKTKTIPYSLLPSGSISAELNYAGDGPTTGDSLIAKTGGGSIAVEYNIVGNDDNLDGTVAITEIGHGRNVNVTSVAGNIDFAGGTNLTNFTHVATLGNVLLNTGDYTGLNGIAQVGGITLGFNALDVGADFAGVVNSTGGFEGSTGNIGASTTMGGITVAGLFGAAPLSPAAFGYTNPVASMFDGKVGTFTLTSTGGGNINAVAGVTFNSGQGLVKATTNGTGTINGTFNANSPTVITGNGMEFLTDTGAITTTIGAARFDANNNGIFTADEYGRTGPLSYTSSGGTIQTTLNSSAYVSALEQSRIGNVLINNKAAVTVNLGAFDTIGAGLGAVGNIAIIGTSVGAVGNLTATTDTGTITETGLFGDLGNTVLTTGAYFDVDTVPNVNNEAAVFQKSGNIVLGSQGFQTVAKGADTDPGFPFVAHVPLEINGTRGTTTLTVIENGTIAGSVYYGGSTTTNTIKATSQTGAISLAVWTQDVDRSGNGKIEAAEYGQSGNIDITSNSGSIMLALGTDQNNAAVVARNQVPELMFGTVTLKTGDIYDNPTSTANGLFTDGKTRPYLGAGSISATAADVASAVGSVTLMGVGADATSVAFSAYNDPTGAALAKVLGNRGTVGAITIDVTRGVAQMQGVFNTTGAVDMEAGTYVDVTSATNTSAIAGTVNFGAAGSLLVLTGAHNTATLHTAVSKSAGTGTITGGAVFSNVIYGGDLVAGSTNSIVATTDASLISLTLLAEWYDIDGNGLITDLTNQNTQGVPINEFADLGKISATTGGKDVNTAQGGNIVVFVGTDTANGSLVGSTIGNLDLKVSTLVRTTPAAAVDTNVINNITVTGISPRFGGTLGDINANTANGTNGGAGNITVTGNFNNVGSFNLTTGFYTDISNAASVVAFTPGSIVLGNAAAGADNANADIAGKTTLNIGGSYNDSALSVQKQGLITGEVFVAGPNGKNWTLTADTGAIDVNYVAGFDADGKDTAGLLPAAVGYDPSKAIGPTEAGKLGNITASSISHGMVTIGVGGREATSAVGNVTVTTGSTVVDNALGLGADTFTNGIAEIQGLAFARTGALGADATANTLDDPTNFFGTVGDLTVTTKFGNSLITGDLNNIGKVTMTVSAHVDNDSNTTVGNEDPIIDAAGDVFFGTVATPVFIGGTYGNLAFKAVDTSALPVGLASKSAALVTATGDVNATAFFAGPTSGASTITANTDRGNIVFDIEAGFDKDNIASVAPAPVFTADGLRSTGEESAKVGDIALSSIDGDITLTLDSSALASAYGNVSATTGTTLNVVSGADTIISTGDITLLGTNDGETTNGNLGTVASIKLAATTGAIGVTTLQWNVGPSTFTTGSILDADSNSTISGEEPVVVQAGDITITNYTIYRNHGTITATTGDQPANGRAVGDTGNIGGAITLFGSLAAGSTTSIIATTQQGNITGPGGIGGFAVTSGRFEKIVDTGLSVGNTAVNTDDFLGNVGDVIFTSTSGAVATTLSTVAALKVVGSADPAILYSKIGNVTATTGDNYSAVAAAPDTPNQTNGVTIVINAAPVIPGVTAPALPLRSSAGIIGNINGTAGSGPITLAGFVDNVIGNLTLTGGQYIDLDSAVGVGEPALVQSAGSITHTATYGSVANTTVGMSTFTTTGAISDLGAGFAGNIVDFFNAGNTWVDVDADGIIDDTVDVLAPLGVPDELRTVVTFGATKHTVTDGTLAYAPLTTGSYGVKLDNITLTSTGLSVSGGTGDIAVSGGGSASQISNLTASGTTGNVTYAGAFVSPSITNLTFRSVSGNGVAPATNGNVTFSGTLNLGLPQLLTSRTQSVAIDGVTLQADNGNVVLSGNLGEALTYNLGDFISVVDTATSDNRLATISNVALIASNGATDNLALDGNVTISGRIGGEDITQVTGLVLNAGNTVDDKTIFAAGAASNIQAWRIGTLATTGTTTFTNTGVAANIIADDSITTRELNGTALYRTLSTGVAIPSTAAVSGIGSVLNTIDNISFNGAVIGGAANSMTAGALAEIMASKVGNVTVNANVDPTSTTVFSVTDFDIAALPMGGEFIAQNAAAKAASGHQTLDAFSMGNVSITHNLQGASNGSAVFSGSSAFVAGGTMGNIDIRSTLKGTVQAPLFAALANGNAWFDVGDIDGFLAVGGGTAAAYAAKTTTGVALTAVPTATLTVGNVTLDVGSSYLSPAVQNADIGNAGGGLGGGFAVIAGLDANAAGNFFDAAGATGVVIDATNVLNGKMGSVSVANNSIRPDNTNVGAVAPIGTAAPGVVAVAGDGTAVDDIFDMVNELIPAGVVPMEDGQFYTVGDPDLGGNADANDVVVYVL